MKIDKKILETAFELMCTARELSQIYEDNKEVTSKYVALVCKSYVVFPITVSFKFTDFAFHVSFWCTNSSFICQVDKVR